MSTKKSKLSMSTNKGLAFSATELIVAGGFGGSGTGFVLTSAEKINIVTGDSFKICIYSIATNTTFFNGQIVGTACRKYSFIG